MYFVKKLPILSAALSVGAASGDVALAQKKDDAGATDTEITIGNIVPYSGPASAYGIIGRTEAAYFKKINEAGGINGRKIKFVPMTTPTRRRRRWSRRASWSRATRCCSSSALSALPPTARS